MSEQPALQTTTYDERSNSTRFADDYVVDFQKASSHLRSLAEVEAERRARQAVDAAYTSGEAHNVQSMQEKIAYAMTSIENLCLVRMNEAA